MVENTYFCGQNNKVMRILAIIALIICSCIKTFAEPHKFYLSGLEILMQEHGLANNTLLEIYQDKKGFLWLGTDVGVSRYDGVSFHNYELTEREPLAVKRICEMEADSVLWLKLDNVNRIACFDKRNGSYITLTSKDNTLLNSVTDLCVSDSVLYALTNKGVARLDYKRESGTIDITPTFIVKHPSALRDLVQDANYLYAFDDANNVLLYDKKSQKKQILEYGRLKTTKPIEHIYAVNGHLWISTHWNGTYCYNPISNELRQLELANMQFRSLNIEGLDFCNDSTLIAATPHSILHIAFSGKDYMHSAIDVQEMSFDNSLYNSFIQNRITKLYVDKKNAIIWLGTFGKGLVKSSMQDKDINRIFLRDEIKNITNLAQDARGYIWLTTERNGVWKSTTNQVSPDLDFRLWEWSRGDQYYCMHKDTNGGLWIGDESGIVQWLNPLTNQIVRYRPTSDGINSIGSIRKIYLCIHNRLWLVTNKGLFVYDYLADKCFASMPFNVTIKKITSMAEDGDGIMWLGTNDGIRSAEVNNGVIELKNGREQKAGISKGEVLAVYVNRHNQLYISYADKIVQTDGLREEIFDIKILKKDMASGHTTCIIDDKSGNTWMGNNMGIMTIHNKTKTAYTYNFPERFYDVCQLNNGQLMWTNSLGLMYFSPRALKNRDITSPLYISDIEINYNKVDIGEEIGGQVVLEKSAYLLDELVLSHHNNNIVFYLTNLNYNQMPNKIEYRLLPDYPEWTSSYITKIEYGNLRPGDYQLEVRPISINDGEAPVTTLKIHINEHWSLTTWAIILYVIAGVTFGLLLRSYFKGRAIRREYRKQKEELMKKSLSEEMKLRKEEKEINRLKSHARYAVISELRTPLSMVLAPLKDIMADATLAPALSPKAKVAYRNVISMQNICGMMEDIYKQESEEKNLNVGAYLLSDIITGAISSSNELLNVAPINVHYDKLHAVKKEVWIDRKKMEYVFRNILFNAYRHINFSGNISINVYTEKHDDKEYCCCQIKDDGKKIASVVLGDEQEQKAFDNQQNPELMGVAFIKEYVGVHHGTIKMEQNAEGNICVVVSIPMGKEHFENEANVSFVEAEEVKPAEIVTAEKKEMQANEEEEVTFAASAPKGKHKMLIIEDNKDIRLYMKILFGNEYTLFIADNGEDGIALARKEMPDIILSDVMMPGISGFDITQTIKEDLKTCHIPIILLTALVGETNMIKGLELGADDYILKPFNPDVLTSKVKRLIKNRMDLKQTYMRLMMNTATPVADEEVEQKEDPFILQIIENVEQNLQNPDFSVKRLAEMLNMSQPTLYRRVKMLTNYTIIELIRGVRMRRAAELLRTKRYSIQEVSEMVGYNDAPTFRKHFVDFYGTTPSTFVSKEETKTQNSM